MCAWIAPSSRSFMEPTTASLASASTVGRLTQNPQEGQKHSLKHSPLWILTSTSNDPHKASDDPPEATLPLDVSRCILSIVCSDGKGAPNQRRLLRLVHRQAQLFIDRHTERLHVRGSLQISQLRHAAPRFTELRELTATLTPGSSCLPPLADSLARLSGLTRLVIQGTNDGVSLVIDGRAVSGLTAVAGSLRNLQQLRDLELRVSAPSCAYAALVAAAGQLPRLRCLVLPGCHGEEDAAVCAALANGTWQALQVCGQLLAGDMTSDEIDSILGGGYGWVAVWTHRIWLRKGAASSP